MSSTDGIISKTAGRKDKKGILLYLVTFKTAKNGKSCQMRELLIFCRFLGTALLSMTHKIDEFGQPDNVLARLVIAIKLL